MIFFFKKICHLCWIATALIPALGEGRGRQICESSKPACSTREFQASRDYKQNEKNPPHSPSSNGVKRGHRLLTQRSEYMDVQEERGQRVHNGHYGDFNRDIKVDYGMGISWPPNKLETIYCHSSGLWELRSQWQPVRPWPFGVIRSCDWHKQ